MAEAPMAVPSAVIVPEETTEQLASFPLSAKRRQSSTSEQNAKRPRLSQYEASDAGLPPSNPPNRASERRKSGLMEERKRGQRLFGALLGTLSQSSSSTAQKRRTDIERKQQAKLKLQADEFDEKKKQQVDKLMDFRRREQRKYDKQSMQIRHSNLLAQAHFLITEAEPKLYYKPWEFSPGQAAAIKSQLAEAEETIERESVQRETEEIADEQLTPSNLSENHEHKQEQMKSEPATEDTVGPITNKKEDSNSRETDSTNADQLTKPADPQETSGLPEALKDQNDDGGEVMEAAEDTVIY